MEWNWILEEYDDMVYVSDLNNYELLYVNRAGLDMFHLSREELFSGKKYLCYEIFHGRNTPCPFCTNNYLKDSGFYEWEHYNEQLGKTYLLKDRKVLWDGRESRIEFVFDVSKYKNKLDKQGKQQAAMLRSLPGGIARLDARDERTILWYGSEFLSIIGYTEEQFKEELQSQCLYVHPEDLEQAEAAMHEAKETGRSSIMQGRIVTRSGKIRHLTITFSYMDGKDSEDGIPSYYSLGIDVTGAWAVAANALSYDYLWNEIRVKGGAYGCGFRAAGERQAAFYTYRDPAIDPSIERVARAGEWLGSCEPDEAAFEGFIVSCVSGMDAPVKPYALTKRRNTTYLAGLDPHAREERRAQMLAATPGELRSLGADVTHIAAESPTCVFGGRDVIAKSSAGFNVIDLMG